MTDLQPPDAESLRLELQEAITTFRHQIALLIQATGVIVTADSILLAYGFSQRQSGVLLVASLMPIAVLAVFFAIMTGLIPVSYVAIRLERKLSLHEAPFMLTWVSQRDDLPYSSLRELEDLDKPEIRDSILTTTPWYILKSRKALVLLGAFIIQLALVITSIAVFHYRFM